MAKEGCNAVQVPYTEAEEAARLVAVSKLAGPLLPSELTAKAAVELRLSQGLARIRGSTSRADLLVAILEVQVDLLLAQGVFSSLHLREASRLLWDGRVARGGEVNSWFAQAARALLVHLASYGEDPRREAALAEFAASGGRNSNRNADSAANGARDGALP